MNARLHASVRGAAVLACAAALAATLGCSGTAQPTYASPEDAAKALIDVAKGGTVDDLVKMLGPGSQPLVDAADPAGAREHRQVFVVAAAEGWRLDETGSDGRVLVIGNESWPFPVPIVKDGNRWRFDAAAGVEEVLARRIGENELGAIRACRTYVFAQMLYARSGHDGKPAGLYATALRSDAGRQNGLYWPATHGEKRSPLGDLIADAGDSGKSPFHGYHFKILTSREANVLALVAWPASYDATGVMTFVVDQDGIVREKDLGPDTEKAVSAMAAYSRDTTWDPVK